MTLVIALGAAFAFGASVALQHHVAAALPTRYALRLGMLARLAQRPVWLAGVVASLLGFGLQAVALEQGSLVLVQPVLTTSLVFALVLVVAFSDERMSWVEWASLIAVLIGLSVFLVLAEPVASSAAVAAAHAWIALLVAVTTVVGALAAVGLRRTGRGRAALLGFAAGIANGAVAVLTKVFAEDLSRSVFTVWRDWPFWALLAAGVPAVLLVQTVYQSGRLSISLPIITVVEPFVAAIVGLTMFGERVDLHGLRGVLVAGALVLAATGLLSVGRDPRVAGVDEPPATELEPTRQEVGP